MYQGAENIRVDGGPIEHRLHGAPALQGSNHGQQNDDLDTPTMNQAVAS